MHKHSKGILGEKKTLTALICVSMESLNTPKFKEARKGNPTNGQKGKELIIVNSINHPHSDRRDKIERHMES